MWWAKKLPLNAMAIELSQHLREKIILNNILATDFDLNMKNNYRTLIYNNFLLKNKRINFISFFLTAPHSGVLV